MGAKGDELVKKLASVLSLELRNLRMFYRTDTAQLYILVEIGLAVIFLGLIFLLGWWLGSR